MKPEFKRMVLDFQKGELNAYLIYKKLSLLAKGNNKKLLERISLLEFGHYNFWKAQTNANVSPDNFLVFQHSFFARLFGLAFALKLLEKRESASQKKFEKLVSLFPKLRKQVADEERQELGLIRKIHDENLEYVGSMMLGVGDAVVEFTGTLSGLAFALQDTKLIGIAGLIGGIAAAMSMGSSEYLAKKSEGTSGKNPRKAAVYTGLMYFVVVFLLVLPNFLFKNAYYALAGTILLAFLVIVFFTYFVSVTKESPFKRRLAETLVISFGIAAISFAIGVALRIFLNIQV